MIIKTENGYQVVSIFSGRQISEPDIEYIEAEKYDIRHSTAVKTDLIKIYTNAYEKWRLLAEDITNAEALFQLGKCYFKGKGVEKDIEKAVDCFSKAASLNNLSAMYYLGLCYSSIEWDGQDTKMEYQWYLKAADGGHPEAQYRIGRYYLNGNRTLGIEKNYDNHIVWYKRAAMGGYGEAQRKLGYHYTNEYQGDYDIEKAVYWWSKAADQGDNFATDALCGLCKSGGIPLEESKVANWRLKAAQLGDRNAAYQLALCFEEGTGVQQDIYKALKWKMIAAARGHQYACIDLGIYLLNEDDYQESLKYFKKVSDTWPEAMYWIGVHYEEGLGVPENEKEAYDWYYKAASEGEAKAQYKIGLRLKRDAKCFFEKSKAFTWLLRAAINGSEDAMFDVGMHYANGDGVVKDYANAYFWLYLATKCGCFESEAEMTTIAQNLTADKLTELIAIAEQWLRDYEIDE